MAPRGADAELLCAGWWNPAGAAAGQRRGRALPARLSPDSTARPLWLSRLSPRRWLRLHCGGALSWKRVTGAETPIPKDEAQNRLINSDSAESSGRAAKCHKAASGCNGFSGKEGIARGCSTPRRKLRPGAGRSAERVVAAGTRGGTIMGSPGLVCWGSWRRGEGFPPVLTRHVLQNGRFPFKLSKKR